MNIERLQTFCRVVGLMTLAICVLASFLFGKTVHYSIQTLNFVFLLFLTQGYAIDGFTDWLQYIIVGLKEASLIVGFTGTYCTNCEDNSLNLRYGYQPLFSQNAGAVFTIDLVLLFVVSIVVFIEWKFKDYFNSS
jgi:hypothetical protein